MATVYLGRNSAGGEAAIKLMRDELGLNPEYRARFEREIKVCLQMDHPGIVRIMDWSVSGEKLFLVMEWVDGKTLRKLRTVRCRGRSLFDSAPGSGGLRSPAGRGPS